MLISVYILSTDEWTGEQTDRRTIDRTSPYSTNVGRQNSQRKGEILNYLIVRIFDLRESLT